MKITKIGHCCLLIEVEGKRIITDPGSFTVDELITEDIDVVLITHEHADHLHIESVQKIVKSNPHVVVVTNSGVGKLLTDSRISFVLLEGAQRAQFSGVNVEACDGAHEEIYEERGQVQNTGYFIANKLFYPGDSFTDPKRKVDILAFPIGGPWCTVGNAIRYVLKLKPTHALPVHDGIERSDRVSILHRLPGIVFSEQGIYFHPMQEGDSVDFA